MKMNRRDIIAGLVGGAASGSVSSLALSGLSLSGLALPGQGRAASRASVDLMLGDMRVQTLSDGHLVLPRSMLFAGLDPVAVDQILQAGGLAAGPVEPPINVTLLRRADQVILFDAGAGPGFQATAGRLVSALERANVAPEDVTHVVFTHCHPDHLWGVLDDFDELLFANADYLMGAVEWDYWFAPDTAATIQQDRAAMAVGARRRMGVLAERTTRFAPNQEILPGVQALASHGHTPGHMSFVLRSAAHSLMIGGDAIGNHHVSFAHPDWPIGTDHDAALAARSRQTMLDMLAQDQMRLIGTHLPQGGLGRVERAASGFRFVPDATDA